MSDKEFEHIIIEWPTKVDDQGAVVREGTIDGNYAVISINRHSKPFFNEIRSRAILVHYLYC